MVIDSIAAQNLIATNTLNHKIMGLIKEPKGIDFIINSEPLTKEEEVKLSEFIAKRKREIAKLR